MADNCPVQRIFKDIKLLKGLSALEGIGDYSTTEKAIGTWIDGRTVYRRVVELDSDINISMLEYLKRINGFKNLSETIRKIIEKEYRKEKEDDTKGD